MGVKLASVTRQIPISQLYSVFLGGPRSAPESEPSWQFWREVRGCGRIFNGSWPWCVEVETVLHDSLCFRV